MTEPIPPSEPAPDQVQPPVSTRRRWQRASIYLGSIALILMMWICGILYSLRQHPERFVHDLLAQLPFPSSTGDVSWQNRRTLVINDLKLGDFFYADQIVVVASPVGLLRRHVAKVQIIGGQLFTKPLYVAMDQFSASGARRFDWTIGRLEISRGTVMLQTVAVDTPIPVRLGVRQPVVLHALKLGEPDSSPEMTEEQMAEIGNVNIVSPVDPVAPVFSFPLIRVRFTYNELWHHQIRNVELIRPTMFLGEDLFWFTAQFKKEHATLPAEGPTAPWKVDHFQVEYGQLAVNAFGQPVVHFPFFFDTTVDDIRLDQLDKISAKSTIAIKRLDQDYPDYKIQLVGLTGRLYFSMPPTDENANNVVNTLSIEEIAWNDIPVKGVSTTLTFDPNGVYGKLNGKCEGGQLAGNFEFYYTKGFTWNADFFADKINCQPIAEKMAGKYVDMTGELDGKLSVQGKATEILNCQGLLTLPNPGVMEIKSMDKLMDRFPADMSVTKKDMAKIALKAFQTYPYQSGELKIDYKPEGGSGTLSLASPLGQRQFDVFWHPYASSKVAKDTDNR
jgi:hypothetical protein